MPTTPPAIPFMNLSGLHQRMKPEILAAIEKVIDDGAFIQGKHVAGFEHDFAEMHELPHAAGCSNGTSAISIALRALGIGAGDQVITVANTFIATAEAICEVGAIPVFVDADPETYAMDVKKFEAAITPKTKAVVPVHLYGNPVDMDSVMALASKHGLRVIEDCAQAHFSRYCGKYVGTFGDGATFSFFPGKNLGAIGDAGLVAMKLPEHDRQVRLIIDHGRDARSGKKYEHEIAGSNYRMDGIQGAVLSVQLRHMMEWTRRRQENARHYDRLLGAAGFQTMKCTAHSGATYHLYVVQVSNRQAVIDHLTKAGIGTGIHYPIPLHLQQAFSWLKLGKGSFPVAERLSERLLSLPFCSELTSEQIEKVVNVFKEAAKS